MTMIMIISGMVFLISEPGHVPWLDPDCQVPGHGAGVEDDLHLVGTGGGGEGSRVATSRLLVSVVR